MAFTMYESTGDPPWGITNLPEKRNLSYQEQDTPYFSKTKGYYGDFTLIKSEFDIKLDEGDFPDPANYRFRENTYEPIKYPFKFDKRKMINYWKKIKNISTIDDLPVYKIAGMPTFEKELIRFKYLLRSYITRMEGKRVFYDWKTILKRSILEGPAFAESLKDLRKYSMIATFSQDVMLGLPESDFTILESDIEEIYDPQCLIRWDITPPNEWELAKAKPEPIEANLRDEIQAKATQLLMEFGGNVPKLDLLDDLRYLRQTRVLIDHDEKIMTNLEAHLVKDNQRNINHITCVLTPVWKNSEELREAVTLDINSLHIMSDCSKILSEILKKIPGYHVHDAMEMATRLYKSRHKLFCMIDYSKCGWTISRDLVCCVIESILEVYDIPVLSKLLDLYRKPIKMYHNDKFDEWSWLSNGTLLGMSIEVVTFASVILFNLGKDKGLIPENTSGWFNNDDTLLLLPSDSNFDHERLVNYASLLEEAGFKIHKKKPFVSEVGQWAEVWSQRKNFNTEKSLRQYSRLLDCLDSHNICEAKVRFSAVYKKFWGLKQYDNKEVWAILLDFFGYEFSPEEIYYPLELGGWVSIKEDGLNTVLFEFENYPLKFRRLLFCDKPELFPFVPKRYSNILGKYCNDFFSSFLVEEDREFLLDWNEQIQKRMKTTEQIMYWKLSSDAKIKYNRMASVTHRYWSKIYKLRNLAFNNKGKIKINNDIQCMVEFKKYLSNNMFNNYKIPDCVIADDIEREDYQVPFFEVPSINDPVRYILYHHYHLPVRVENAMPGCLYSFLCKDKRILEERDLSLRSTFFKNLPKLSRFGSNYTTLMDVVQRHGYYWKVTTPNTEMFELIKNFSLGSGPVTWVLDGIIVSTSSKLDYGTYGEFKYQEYLNQLFPTIHPTFDAWYEVLQEVKEQFDPGIKEEEVVYTTHDQILPSSEFKIDYSEIDRLYAQATVRQVAQRADMLLPPEQRAEIMAKAEFEPISLDFDGYNSEDIGGINFDEDDDPFDDHG
jgi:hypothetical protein